MSPPTQPRPPQVTLAGWLIIVGSVLVVGSVFEMMGGLRSLETQEAIDSFLAEPPGDTLGWAPETVMDFLRIASMVTAGCATAAAVLGWHVLRRHRGARVGLTVLAGPLFVAGVVTGGFMSSLVAAASLMLWLQPARDWFNGKAWTPPGRARKDDADRVGRGAFDNPALPPYPGTPSDARTNAPASAPVSAPTDQPGAEGDARPVQGFGDRPGWSPEPGLSGPALPPRGRRPDVVLAAALVTWIFAGLALLVTSLALLVLAATPDALLDEVERQQPDLAEQGVSEQALLTSTFVFGGGAVLWSLAAIVAAVLLVRGVRWSGTLLVVLAIGAAVLCFVAALSSALMALPALASVLVVVLLRRRDVRAWLAGGLSGAGRPQPGGVPPRR